MIKPRASKHLWQRGLQHGLDAADMTRLVRLIGESSVPQARARCQLLVMAQGRCIGLSLCHFRNHPMLGKTCQLSAVESHRVCAKLVLFLCRHHHGRD